MTDSSLIADFITETGEHLEETERNLLELEQRPGDTELLNDIFRSIHTIKGSSEYLGMERIAGLSHGLENLLDLARREKRKLDGRTVDLLMDAVDRIGVLVSDLSRYQEERTAVDDLMGRIAAVSGAVEPPLGETAHSGGLVQGPDSRNETDDDDYDAELLGIFMDQLNSGLQALVQESQGLFAGRDAGAVLGSCRDRLTILRSAANYMGYDKLKEVYDQWLETLERQSGKAGDGAGVDADDFMDAAIKPYLAQIRTLFPQATYGEEKSVASIAAESAEEPVAAASPESGIPAESELVSDFIIESSEHLEQTELNLLQLRQAENLHDPRLITNIFRSIHTIKGSSEYLGLDSIAELARNLEQLLDAIRQERHRADDSLLDLIGEVKERMEALITDVQNNRQERTPVDDLVDRMKARFSAAAQADPVLPGPSEVHEPEEHVDDAQDLEITGMRIYDEEYDQDLFSVFSAQLIRCMDDLRAEAAKAAGDSEMLPVMDACLQRLVQLEASANYMEYFELRDHYENWVRSLVLQRDRAASGEPVDRETFCRELMIPKIEQVQAFFPKLFDSEASGKKKLVQAGAPKDAPPEAERDLEKANADADEAPEFFNVSAKTSDTSVIHGSDANQELFSLLRSAFNKKTSLVLENGTASLPADVGNHLLSGTNQSPPAFDKQPAQLASRSAETSAQPDILDRFGSDDSSRLTEPPIPSTVVPLGKMTPDRESEVASEDTIAFRERASSLMGRRQADKVRDRLARQSIRVDAAKIDTLLNQVGELVVSRAGFIHLHSDMRELQFMLKRSQKLDSHEFQLIKSLTNRISEATQSLGRITAELQENVMKVRMQPIAQLFSRYPRLVHDLVKTTNKKIDFQVSGEDTELDKMVIEQIADPLLHIIRNAVDHGIEEATQRQRRGKEETGKLSLQAFYESNYVVIQVSDDGAGIDPVRIKACALSKGFVTAEQIARMNEREIIELIMKPGFSTSEEVTLTSGRGVGMDVVKDKIEKLNGTIDIISTPDMGTVFKIKIPLTLAIMPALMVRVGNDLLTIPSSTVDEMLRIRASEIATIEGMEVYNLREVAVPLLRLDKLFNLPGTDLGATDVYAVIVNSGNRRVGLVVDELRGRHEVVIKPLEDYLQEKSGFSGATILGDGTISLILDVPEVINLAMERTARKMKATVG